MSLSGLAQAVSPKWSRPVNLRGRLGVALHSPALRVRLAIALSAAGMAIALVPAPAAAQSSEGCRATGSRTVVATNQGRIFTIRDRLAGRPVTFYFGCLYRVNRAFALGRDFQGRTFTDTLRHARLAGPYAGYAVTSTVEQPCGSAAEVRVKDLRTGRMEQRAPGAAQSGPERITDLELKPNSSVAWIATTCVPAGPGRDEVRAIDGDGRRTLDTGVDGAADDVQGASLALSGSTLYWTKGGAAVTARLR